MNNLILHAWANKNLKWWNKKQNLNHSWVTPKELNLFKNNKFSFLLSSQRHLLCVFNEFKVMLLSFNEYFQFKCTVVPFTVHYTCLFYFSSVPYCQHWGWWNMVFSESFAPSAPWISVLCSFVFVFVLVKIWNRNAGITKMHIENSNCEVVLLFPSLVTL